MIHAVADDTIRTRAALYAVGALDAEEAREFRAHLQDGCRVCQSELRDFERAAGELSLDAPPVAPSAAVRARVLDAVRAHATGGYVFVGAQEGDWVQVAPGVSWKHLAGDHSERSRSYLIRMAPGARGGRHLHAAAEHCLVLEGDFCVAGRRLGPGDFHRAAPGTMHEGNSTENGCLLLIVEAA